MRPLGLLALSLLLLPGCAATPSKDRVIACFMAQTTPRPADVSFKDHLAELMRLCKGMGVAGLDGGARPVRSGPIGCLSVPGPALTFTSCY